jgi:hypothetical protein
MPKRSNPYLLRSVSAASSIDPRNPSPTSAAGSITPPLLARSASISTITQMTDDVDQPNKQAKETVSEQPKPMLNSYAYTPTKKTLLKQTNKYYIAAKRLNDKTTLLVDCFKAITSELLRMNILSLLVDEAETDADPVLSNLLVDIAKLRSATKPIIDSINDPQHMTPYACNMPNIDSFNLAQQYFAAKEIYRSLATNFSSLTQDYIAAFNEHEQTRSELLSIGLKSANKKQARNRSEVEIIDLIIRGFAEKYDAISNENISNLVLLHKQLLTFMHQRVVYMKSATDDEIEEQTHSSAPRI